MQNTVPNTFCLYLKTVTTFSFTYLHFCCFTCCMQQTCLLYTRTNMSTSL